MNVHHDTENKRFYLEKNHSICELNYKIKKDDVLDLQTTFVPKSLRGLGLGSMLIEHALTFVDMNHKKIIPTCPFIKAYIDKHPKYKHLIAK